MTSAGEVVVKIHVNICFSVWLNFDPQPSALLQFVTSVGQFQVLPCLHTRLKSSVREFAAKFSSYPTTVPDMVRTGTQSATLVTRAFAR